MSGGVDAGRRRSFSSCPPFRHISFPCSTPRRPFLPLPVARRPSLSVLGQSLSLPFSSSFPLLFSLSIWGNGKPIGHFVRRLRRAPAVGGPGPVYGAVTLAQICSRSLFVCRLERKAIVNGPRRAPSPTRSLHLFGTFL